MTDVVEIDKEFLLNLTDSVSNLVIAGLNIRRYSKLVQNIPNLNIDLQEIDLAQSSQIKQIMEYVLRQYHKIDIVFLIIGLKTMNFSDKTQIDYSVYCVLNVMENSLRILKDQDASRIMIAYAVKNMIVAPKLKFMPALDYIIKNIYRGFNQMEEEKGLKIEFLSPEMFFNGYLKS